jgi:hypothetical protein
VKPLDALYEISQQDDICKYHYNNKDCPKVFHIPEFRIKKAATPEIKEGTPGGRQPPRHENRVRA